MADLITRRALAGDTGETLGAVAVTCHDGVAAGTRILTLDGLLPVEFLEPGDRIITRSGARALRSISVRIAARESVMRITGGALGFDRPEGAVLIGSDQAVLVRDWRAKAMFGQAQATVPVTALTDGVFIAPQQVDGLRFYALSFDTAEVIYAEGIEIATVPVPAMT